MGKFALLRYLSEFQLRVSSFWLKSNYLGAQGTFKCVVLRVFVCGIVLVVPCVLCCSCSCCVFCVCDLFLFLQRAIHRQLQLLSEGGGSSSGRVWSCSCRAVCVVLFLFVLCVCVYVTCFSSCREPFTDSCSCEVGGGSSCGRLWCCSRRLLCGVVLVVLVVCLCVRLVSLLTASHLQIVVVLSEGGGSSSGRLWCCSCRVVCCVVLVVCFVCVTCFSSYSEPFTDSCSCEVRGVVLRLVVCGVVRVEACVVLFLFCVCVCVQAPRSRQPCSTCRRRGERLRCARFVSVTKGCEIVTNKTNCREVS